MRSYSALILVFAFSAFGEPAQVILLRHAEKPADPAAVHLSARGEERARALATLLAPSSPLTSAAPIAALYASRITQHGHSQRTGETLDPLARKLHLSVKTPYGSGDYRRLAENVLGKKSFRGKTVVICWTHHDIAELAAALGVKPAPRPWKESVFDRLWVISFHDGHAELKNLPQHLLPGDSTD